MKIFLDDNRRNPIDLSASGTSRTGYNACDFLVRNNIQCPKITIHSDHPKAVEMYDFFINQRKYEWRGWCFKYEKTDKK